MSGYRETEWQVSSPACCPGPVPVQTENLSGACYGCLPASRLIFFLWKPQDMGGKSEENNEFLGLVLTWSYEYQWDTHLGTGKSSKTVSALKSEVC